MTSREAINILLEEDNINTIISVSYGKEKKALITLKSIWKEQKENNTYISTSQIINYLTDNKCANMLRDIICYMEI